MQTSAKIITIIFVYACTCVGDPGAPGQDGSPGEKGDVGDPGVDGESLVWSVSFHTYRLIMNSLLYLTYNVIKLPINVCVLISEVL